MEIITNPKLLQHPNIPKPLHGLSPRAIKGKEWWDKKRQEVYKSTNYHCKACGVHKSQAKYHKWLEAHEDYTIDYEKGTMEIKDIVPLCHSCHNFIHSGRLFTVEDDLDKVAQILERGFNILNENGLEAPYAANIIAIKLEIDYDIYVHRICEPELPPTTIAEWDDWKLIFEGEEYYSKFNSLKEWAEYYRKQWQEK